jgi:hypothetical protein
MKKIFAVTILKLSMGVYSLLRGVVRVHKTYSEQDEKKLVDGFVMKNDSNGVEVKCTEQFVKHWIARGFKVVEQRPISILS